MKRRSWLGCVIVSWFDKRNPDIEHITLYTELEIVEEGRIWAR